MQGKSGPDRELLDAAVLCRALVPDGSVEAFLADHRRELFPDELFGDLFPSGRGRPSVPADVIATVMVLQALEGLSDRDAARAVRDRISWKVAAGLALDDVGFDYSVLTYWRSRLRRSDRPDRIFDAVRAVVAESGVLAGKSRRALDSTLLDDAVATQDTVTQLISAIRRVRRVIPAAAAVAVSAHDYDHAGKPTIAWDDPVAKDALVTGLVNDALAILAAFDDVELTGDQRSGPRSEQRVIPRPSNRSRSRARCRAGLTVTTSSSITRHAPRVVPAGTPWRSTPRALRCSVFAVETARYANAAPPQRRAASSTSVTTTPNSSQPAALGATATSPTTTGNGDPWSNVPSPGSSHTDIAGSATAASNATTTASRCAPLRSTCADSSTSDLSEAPPAGHSRNAGPGADTEGPLHGIKPPGRPASHPRPPVLRSVMNPGPLPQPTDEEPTSSTVS